ncbi:hypothetical protein A2872_03665 [Candidatus Gottesmanbacteria bacterium RIFCSPHIGHO2_01_FULL_42_12]|uniref:Right handed beta helix domain-containing protein n=1 Tax=Candidatus Gottesmanbacteria bacterium RIFCSPHIGHO2_01_FULL_42_12 TaxID=1798377 RepID=A0A1F5Z4M4_9BACT|nr:MAG: hypothetical protein A2872_03665 [Candidatus Gottesmanbacteria bacterium RIFCSPHIGHO2_01_FULL_42_12]
MLKNKLALVFLFLTFFIIVSEQSKVYAVVKTITPSGNIVATVGTLGPGDQLIFEDGVYKQTFVISGLNGTAANPIIIKARNDGRAIIDGEAIENYTANPNSPCPGRKGFLLQNSSYVVLEGFYFRNHNGWGCNTGSVNGTRDGVSVGNSHNIIVRRVSERSTISGANTNGFKVEKNSVNVLLEDVASYGNNRNGFVVNSSSQITIRRCFNYFEEFNNTDKSDQNTNFYSNLELHIGDVPNSIVENCVGFVKKGAVLKNLGGSLGNAVHGYLMGSANDRAFGLISKDATDAPYHFAGASSSLYENSIAINSNSGTGANRDGGGNAYNKFTWVNETKTAPSMDTYNGAISYQNVLISGSNGLRAYLRYPSTATTANVSWETTIYGDGAYLMPGSPQGATVIYRYQDGILTNVPLWPWPMEERIVFEAGISVTWATNGGLWKTLNGVYTNGPVKFGISDLRQLLLQLGTASNIFEYNNLVVNY